MSRWLSRASILSFLTAASLLVGASRAPAEPPSGTVSAIGQFELDATASATDEWRELVRLAFNPSGDRLASSDPDGTVRLWDLEGNELAALPHPHWVWQLQFSSDGDRLLTASSDGATRLWALDGSLQTIFQPNQPFAWQAIARFLPDGEQIVTSHFGGPALLWDRDGRCQVSFNQVILQSAVSDLPDNRRLGQCETGVSTPLPAIRSLDVSPDGAAVLTAERETVQVWDRQGNPTVELRGHTNQVNDARFSPDGEAIVTASADNTARLWDRESRQLASFDHDSSVATARFSPDGERVLTLTGYGLVQIWSRQGEAIATLADLAGEPFLATAWALAGGRLIAVTQDGRLQIRDRQGQLLTELPGSLAFAVSAAGDRLAAFDPATGTVNIWQLTRAD